MSLSISFKETSALLLEIDTTFAPGDHCFFCDFNLYALQQLDIFKCSFSSGWVNLMSKSKALFGRFVVKYRLQSIRVSRQFC